MSKLIAYRITKIFLTIHFIAWFVVDTQIGFIITFPYIIAMTSLPSKVAR
jgi:hypothetical protein